jgi:hypothetical protein
MNVLPDRRFGGNGPPGKLAAQVMDVKVETAAVHPCRFPLVDGRRGEIAALQIAQQAAELAVADLPMAAHEQIFK